MIFPWLIVRASRSRAATVLGLEAIAVAALLLVAAPHGVAAPSVLEGRDALAGWRSDAPGVRRLIRPEDLPGPYSTPPAKNPALVLPPPANAAPMLPAGFSASIYARGFNGPRKMVTAPNGDIFLAEESGGAVRVLRSRPGSAAAAMVSTFVEGLSQPSGLAFYPPKGQPQWLYVATTTQLLRYPYRTGDVSARGQAQVMIAKFSEVTGGHAAHDIAFSNDGRRLFIAVGSTATYGIALPRKPAAELHDWEAEHGLGVAWGNETDHAVVRVSDANGATPRNFAAGLRYCIGIVVRPGSNDPWCANHEGEGLGEDYPSDFLTSLTEGAFYGYPWFPNGLYEDPRRAGERPDLATRVTRADVLLGSHRSPMDLVFYDATSGPAVFPPEYRGQLFAALHGSNNSAGLVGFKVVRAVIEDGKATGEVEDFMTGFVLDDETVWARPSGIAVARDGALLVADDGNGVVYRVAYDGKRK